MMFKITREQIRAFFLTTAALLAAWIIMGHYARLQVVEGIPEGQVLARVSFLAPMNHQKAADSLTLTCVDYPGRKVAYHAEWISGNTIQIAIDESEYPRGLRYSLIFKKAPALIPPFSVSVSKKLRIGLVPRVIALDPPDKVPTGGPLVLVFNTPVDPESFRGSVRTTVPGAFSPLELGDGGEPPLYDYSRWVLTPEKKLENSTGYGIVIEGGLHGAGGVTSPVKAEIGFTTAPALEIAEIYPRPYDPSVWLGRHITVRADQDLREARIEVDGVPGKVSVSGKNAEFIPGELFLPSGKYQVTINLTSAYGEKVSRSFWFGTTNLGNQRWIGIKVGNPSTVKVYEGNKTLATFEGWLTLLQEKAPRVTMYEVKRDSSTGLNPKDTSPVRYIQLNADIMIHHLRPGEPHNHDQSGIPPSYGCVLLNKPDLDWIYSNVPAKCMVVMH